MDNATTLQTKSNSRSGIGLVEVMVALFVFSASVAGMCALALICREASDRSRDHYIAVNLAKNRLERAKSFGFSQMGLFAETNLYMDYQGTPKTSTTGDFRRSTIVSNVNANLIEIRVSVEIRNRDTWSFVPGVEDIRSYVANVSTP